ncbi:tol-pal system YbgF family protein, partial [Novosphingobium sp.]|uniref:tetratricopeptide repeat protein n=1 Tax=Novosphingobium sp. TaxID=1874826 RepID=UPI0035AF28B2
IALVATLGAGLILPMPAFGQTVSDRALSDVRVESAGGCAVVTIAFNPRIQVLSSFPAQGRELHIRVTPLDQMPGLQGRESLRTPTALPELRSIEYEGDNAAGPTLSMFFTRDMKFEVSAGQQPQTVVIRVSDPTVADCSAPATGQAERLIADAEQAITEGNLDRAVALLTDAAALPENPNTPRAIELLGVTRERKGQNAHARAQYEEYLRRYPEGEGADRVRQRLAALDAKEAVPGTPQQLRAASGGTEGATAWKWGARGSFSQFYFRDQGRTSTLNTSSTLGTEVDNSVNVNQLLTTGDITITGGNDKRQIQMRAAGSFTKNFGTSRSIVTVNNGTETRTYASRPGGTISALTALYFDYSDTDLDTTVRVGRQTRNSAGVLGRFDGALVGWQANPKLRFNAVAGYPVLSSRQTWVLKERPFYGFSVDLGNKRSPFQTTLYWFDEHAKGGFIDRRSVGIEARFLKKNFNAFGLLDYDVKFGTVNLALVTLNYNFPDGANLAVTGDYRKSPLLTTTNALIGQFDTVNNVPFNDLAGLKPFFTDAQIYQMAKDRTLTSKSVTVTYSRPITRKLQLSTDFSMTDTGGTPGTPATAGTPEIGALPAMGKEYFYGVQFIGSDLLMGNDIYILSGRYADTATARIYTIDFNARVPVTSKFRLSPRLRYGYRDGKVTTATANPGTFSQFQPTLRLNYYPLKHSEIEIEFGGNFSRQTVWNGTAFDKVNENGWVLSAGYRLDF